jgi:LysM repeat protein
MKGWKRLLYYLMINVLVSACTILTILVAWERTHNTLPGSLISEIRGTDLDPAAASATPRPENDLLPEATPTESFFVYQVVSGDTFESIAEEYDMSAEELIAINGFTQSQPLGEGEVLRIPVHPKGSVVIDSVIGAGDLETESVLLKHHGDGELSLSGWRLENQEGGIYIFPQVPELVLYKNGAVYVHTRSGANSVVDLYGGLNSPVWHSGEEVTLRDAAGNIRSTYTIP